MIRIGIGLPNGGAHVEAAELVRLAVGAENLGLDSVWVADRWLRPVEPVAVPGAPVRVTMPAEHYRSVFDPIEVLTFIAARTARILLGTSAINALYHPPVLLARRLATLDQLSGGRLIAGVTSGWMAEEFTAAGVPRERMGGGLDDHLAAMRQVWGPDPVTYRGTHYTIPTSDIGPKPRQPGGVPLLMGYTTAAGIRRAARIADGLHPFRNDLGQLTDELALWRDAAASAGRDPTALPVVLRAAASLDTGTAATGDQRPLFSGDVRGWAGDLARVEDLGVDHVFVQFIPDIGVDATLDTLAKLVATRG